MRLSRTVLICLPTVAQCARKVLVYDGLGIWLAARRLHQGKLFWMGSRHGTHVELGVEQLNALVLGLPWQRVGPGDAISIVWRQPWLGILERSFSLQFSSRSLRYCPSPNVGKDGGPFQR